MERRWQRPTTAAVIMVIGLQLHWWLPDPYDVLALGIVASAVQILGQDLSRTTAPGAFRLVAGVGLFHLLFLAAIVPGVGQWVLHWIVVLALTVVVAGPLLPDSLRRNLLGLLLASGWGVVIGRALDGALSREWGSACLYGIGGALLVPVTTAYVRWSRTGELPRPVQKFLDRLPEDRESVDARENPALPSLP